ncbi:MAG: alpha/beta hydrolase [Opitutales bacterium]|nr:alpha/beta hydrolase [Opitutales bacterium]
MNIVVRISTLIGLTLCLAETTLYGNDPEIPEPAGNVIVFRDVPYVTHGHPHQLLDIYLPGQEEQFPLIVWIHGGSWWGGDKHNIGDYHHLTDQGYAVASVGYRRSREAAWPAQIEDCKSAIRWLRAHAANYNIDPERLAVAGFSAGSYLADMIGITSNAPHLFDRGEHLDQPSSVLAVISMNGAVSFPRRPSKKKHWKPNWYDSPYSVLFGGPIREFSDYSRHANAVDYADPTDPPILYKYGIKDNAAPKRRVVAYTNRFRDQGVQVDIFEDSGGHRIKADPEFIALRDAFLEEHLQSKTQSD